jgi:uncharacterized membrane protein YqhA
MTRKWKIAYLAPLALFFVLFIAGVWSVHQESDRIRSGEITERYGHYLVVGSIGIAGLAIIGAVLWLAGVGITHLIFRKIKNDRQRWTRNRATE